MNLHKKMKQLIIFTITLFILMSTSYAASSEQFVPVVTDNHGNTLSASETASNSGGFSFKALDNILLRNISIEPTATPTRALLRYDNGTTITTASISGNYAVFNYELEKDVTYRLEADANGGSYSMKRNDAPTFPTKTNIQYISASKDGVDDGDGFLRNIVGVNSQELLYFNSSDFNVTDINFSASDSHIQDYLFSGEEFIESSRNDGTINGVTYNDGTLTNFVSTVRTNDCINETFGNCLEFVRANSEYVDLGSGTLYGTTDTLSFSLWIKVNSFASTNIAYTFGNDFDTYFETAVTGQLKVRFENSSGGRGTLTTDTVLSTDTWYYITNTYDGATVKTYINGVQDPQTASLTGNIDDSIGNHIIGGRSGGLTSWNGSLDEVRIFDFALNSSQIEAEMNSRNPVETPVASYSFEETQGVTAFDLHTFVQGNNTESRWNKAFSFDGTDDYIDLGNASFLNVQKLSINLDYKESSRVGFGSLINKFDGSSTQWELYSDNGFIKFFVRNGSSSSVTSTSAINLNEWYDITATFSNGVAKIFINGVENASTSGIGFNVLKENTANLKIGERSGTLRINGSLDELKLFNRSLNSTEIQQLANNNYYNTSGLVFESKFEQLTNTQINDRQVDLCYNCSSTTATNTRTDGVYTAWYTDAQDGSSKFTFLTVDTVNPNLQNDLPTELNSNQRDINLSSVITFNDSLSGIESCSIVFNNSQTSNCVNNSFTFNQAGNFTYTITATDNAGNTNTSSSQIEVDPLQIFRFLDSNGTTITNFTFGNISYTGETANFTLFDQGLGEHTLTFEKLGYNTTDLTFNLNLSSTINNNYTVPSAVIFFEFINVNDNSYIESEGNTTITVIGSSFGTVVSTTARNYTLSNLGIVPDTYQVIVSNSNYEAVNTLFTFTNQEYLSLPIYMTPVNLTTAADLIVRVEDTDGNIQKGITTYQYIWDTDTLGDVLINQKVTDGSGETSFKVILDTRSYTFCAEYNNELFCEADQVININTDVLVVPIEKDVLNETTPSNIYEVDFPFSLTNTTNATTNTSLILFTWTNSAQDVDNYCLYVYEIVNGSTTSRFDNCTTNHNSNLGYTADLNTNNTYKAQAYIFVDGERGILDTLKINELNLIEDALKTNGLHKFIALVLLILGVGIGLTKKVHNITFSHIGISLAYLFISLFFESILTFDIFVIVAFTNAGAVILFTKRDDLATKPKLRNLLSILMIYILMIFTLNYVLGDFNDKGLLDAQGEELYDYLNNAEDGKNTDLNTFLVSSEQQLNLTKSGVSVGGEDKTDNTLTTFIKLLGFVDTFFILLSKLFSIPSTLYYMLGFTTSFLTSLIFIIDWIINIVLVKAFYDAIFGK